MQIVVTPAASFAMIPCMPLSWNEIRHRAIAFANEWQGETREAAERQSFWNEFFNVFGVRRRTVATFEEPVRKLSGTWGSIERANFVDHPALWLLARQFEFKGRTLAAAVLATFSNRGTAIDLTPIALTPTFTESPTTRTQWTAFRKKSGLLHAPERLADVVAFLSDFLVPVARACEGNVAFGAHWRPPGPWSSTIS
jgi:hypothetical protein